MLRGDVYLATLDPTEGAEQAGTRPVVIVSRNALNRHSPVVVIVPFTDRRHKRQLFPSQVEVKAGEGRLRKDSVALCEQIRAISKMRLKSHWGQLSPGKMSEIDAALLIALDLPERI